MKAKRIIAEGAGGKRQKLVDILPLEAPLVMQIFPVYGCQLKCNYCVYSTPREKRDFISNGKFLDFKLYMGAIHDLKKFKNKIKVLRFAGLGEPLFHPSITSMISYANGVAENTELITNGLLLTHFTSDMLIMNNLSRLIISINGLSDEDYEKNCNSKIKFIELLNNIRYFYEHKKDTIVHIKTVNTAIKDEEEFYNMFEDICDTIGIENTMPLYPFIDFSEVIKDNSKTQYGLNQQKVKVCPQPFYTCQINPDGNVVLCYSARYPVIIGNINNESIYDIWNGKILKDFRLNILKENICQVCKDCIVTQCRIFPEDILDNDIEKLIKIYE